MVVMLGRTMLLEVNEEDRQDKGPFAKFYLCDIDDTLERVLEVANRLDQRLANDLRALGIEPDLEDFDHEVVTEETAELAHCRNQMEEVHDLLTMIKDIAIAQTGRSSRTLN